ncbi:MAG: hypothetical protein II054_01605 [Treponema sp.]|nr:hypothetical protein [Treponema sp.]MBQ1661175.1 hypothetical protein [Treponema sp.]
MSDSKEDIRRKKAKKKAGAVIIAVIVCLGMLLFLSFIMFAIFNCKEIIVIFGIYAVALICGIIGTVFVLVQRFKEINSGEEDEASKY